MLDIWQLEYPARPLPLIFHCLKSGMGIRIRSDPLIFGLPDPRLFPSDPHPTCNNEYVKSFSFRTKYKSESTKFPFRIKVGSGAGPESIFFSPAEPDPRKKFRILIPAYNCTGYLVILFRPGQFSCARSKPRLCFFSVIR